MKERNICVLRFDQKSEIFRVYGVNTFNLDVIPRIGEKLVFNDPYAMIAEVVDIHYSPDGNVDVFIANERKYVDYKIELDNSQVGIFDLDDKE